MMIIFRESEQLAKKREWEYEIQVQKNTVNNSSIKVLPLERQILA